MVSSTEKAVKTTQNAEFEAKEPSKCQCTCHENQRTPRQNNALHLYFEMLAEALNEAGLDMKKMLKADIPWNAYNVKNELWRPIQEAQIGKKSTANLSTKDIDKVYETLNRLLGEKKGVHVPFPSIETMYYDQR